MNRLMLRILVAACLLIPASNTPAAGPPHDSRATPAGQKPCELDRSVPVRMKYLLHLPEDYDRKESWPLLLFLHGAGERGDNLELVKTHGPPKLIEAGESFPFVVVAPQCPAGRWWEPHELGALIDEIVANHKVDEDRIYVTGLSMGGFGTWALAVHQPERLAAIAPICGGGEPLMVRLLPVKVPAWVFHGAKDTTVPVERSQQMVDALKKARCTVKLTVYPEAGHDSWTKTYANPELYRWLLEQRRAVK